MKPLVFLIGISVAIAGLAGYNVGYVPQQEQVRLTQVQRFEEQANQQLQAEVAALLNQVERYRTRLLPVPDTALLVRKVVALAGQSGVTLGRITQETPKTFPQFTRLTVQLEGSASYHQLGTFLDDLEQSDLFIRVGRLQASRSTQGDDHPGDFTLSVSTLFVPSALPGTVGSN